MTNLRIKLTKEEAEMTLKRLPLPRRFWLGLADRFLKEMENGPDGPHNRPR